MCICIRCMSTLNIASQPRVAGAKEGKCMVLFGEREALLPVSFFFDLSRFPVPTFVPQCIMQYAICHLKHYDHHRQDKKHMHAMPSLACMHVFLIRAFHLSHLSVLFLETLHYWRSCKRAMLCKYPKRPCKFLGQDQTQSCDRKIDALCQFVPACAPTNQDLSCSSSISFPNPLRRAPPPDFLTIDSLTQHLATIAARGVACSMIALLCSDCAARSKLSVEWASERACVRACVRALSQRAGKMHE